MNPHALSVLNNVHNISSTSQLPVAIDYPAALALRQMALVQIPVGPGSERPAPLYPRSAPQDAVGHAVEYRRAY